MTDDMATHATITRSGEIDFPLWAKVVAGMVGVMIPVGIIIATWFASVMWDMSLRMERMEAQITIASDDRYRASQAHDAHDALAAKMDALRENVRELQRLHGRN